MIWSIDQDDLESKLLTAVFNGICNTSVGSSHTYKCNPLGSEKRWWTWIEDKAKAGMCGKNAPLYKGFYPLCDPDDPGIQYINLIAYINVTNWYNFELIRLNQMIQAIHVAVDQAIVVQVVTFVNVRIASITAKVRIYLLKSPPNQVDPFNGTLALIWWNQVNRVVVRRRSN